ncbi:hypothetical protein RJT34_22780 [Clitoria ternatea]|uniref:Uncharacterized protein n=1 Tax=Clitoria ternatea TaxID=43366 RepID=A0AAN9IEC1_CLITE
MLSITTAKIVLQHACDKVKDLLKEEYCVKDEKEACRILREERVPRYSERKSETVVTSKWHMLRDAQRLARNLMMKRNRWQIMYSVWVEMLCYVVANCSIDYHSEEMRRDGGRQFFSSSYSCGITELGPKAEHGEGALRNSYDVKQKQEDGAVNDKHTQQMELIILTRMEIITTKRRFESLQAKSSIELALRFKQIKKEKIDKLHERLQGSNKGKVEVVDLEEKVKKTKTQVVQGK